MIDKAKRLKNLGFNYIDLKIEDGGVPERSNGTDCKSVVSASKVRILLSPPPSERLKDE